MAFWLSEPVEKLLEAIACDRTEERCDVLVVGSGYGGAIAAMRLAGSRCKVLLFERGKEYALGDFPENLGELPGHVRLMRPRDAQPIGYGDALFDLRIGEGVSALVGNGLGGTSLINANVAIEPDDDTLARDSWPKALLDDRDNFRSALRRVKELLGATQDPVVPNKLRAFETLVKAMGGACEMAHISVTFGSEPNAVGVDQSPCVRCGNCVTGCNVGAKNTLPMNLLPLAKTRGAFLYTGATVISVEPDGARDGASGWIVRFRCTATEKSPLRAEVHRIRARRVVLAAGTLGSTEILLRSVAHGMRCSGKLGKRFSTNGDVLAFSYAQRKRVDAVARSGSLDPRPKEVGPTINAYARLPLKDGARMLLEDGAVPESLARIFAEIAVGGSLIQRYLKDSDPAWLVDHPDKDALGIHAQALQHSQTLLGMGDDGAEGELRLEIPKPGAPPPSPDEQRFEMVWTKKPKQSQAFAFQKAAHSKLKEAAEAKGFDGGDYLQNPLWQAVPEEFTKALSGQAPGGHLFTVHPLGGCPMGDNMENGVVNHLGQVFCDRDRCYEGLYVMDGAMIPGPVGVNPFLTISALAWRACDELLKKLGGEAPIWRVARKWSEVPRSRSVVATVKEPVRVVLTERLLGNLADGRPQWFPRPTEHEKGVRNWLAAEIAITISDIDGWLADPGRAWDATCKLYANSVDGDEFEPAHLKEVAAGEGKVRLLAPEGPADDDQKQRRALAAMLTYAHREGITRDPEKEGIGERFGNLLRIARMHAHWRVLDYAFTLRPKNDERAWVLKGRKELAYHPGKPNVWQALTKLPIELSPARAGGAPRETYRGALKVDLVDLSRRALLQARSSPHTPAALMALIGAGMLFLRVLMQTHFWSFPAPDYPRAELPKVGMLPGEIRTRRSGRIEPLKVDLYVPVYGAEGEPASERLRLVLSRYRHKDERRHEPVLLIHGLAHGANVFTTDTIRRPLAAVLHDEGYEPWLLDYRLSPAVAGSSKQSTMDEIAMFDIALAVCTVYKAAGSQPIRVFAHCIGAGCFSMSVLGGHCYDKEARRSMIKAAAIHAVPPWVVPSTANLLRANLAAFVKDAIGDELVNPIPSPEQKVDWRETLIDRLAGSLPWPDGDLLAHNADRSSPDLGHAICNRMTLFYGVEWVHANLSEATHRRLAELVGVGNIETFRQIFFLAQRALLTDREGRNAYLTEHQVRQHWSFPTLFAHGTENGVFNPISSERSACRLKALQRTFNRLDTCPVYLKKVEGYGHMDFLFGKNAASDVFPTILDFFDEGRRKLLPDRVPEEPHGGPRPSPRCGPIIGHAQEGPSGSVKLRLWFEPSEDPTSPPAQIRFTAFGPSEDPTSLPSQIEFRAFEPEELPVTVDSVASVDCPPLDPPVIYMKGCARDDLVQNFDNYGCYWVYDITVPGEAQILRAEVRYGSAAYTRCSDGTDIETPKPSNDPEQDGPLQPALIDLRAPWFRRLAGRAPRSGCTFLAGSCRHPGSPFERDLADAVFEAMLGEVRRDADHVILAGDQIYADATADIFDTREPGERYSGRYREAFSSRHMRRLLRSVPVYMAIDDHEIGDNWDGEEPAAPGAKKLAAPTRGQLSTIALQAARHYTGIMNAGSAERRQTLWYSFESGGLQFFVMDTRSGRKLRRREVKPGAAVLLHEDQMKEFEKWLRKHAKDERPKFVVCGTPLGPVRRDQVENPSLWRRADTWFGYPAAVKWLVRTMVECRPRNVIFLAGDYHLSAVAELVFYCDDKPSVEAGQIVASGLFSPMPFANERLEDFNWDQWCAIPVVDGGECIGVKGTLLAQGRSHFLRVEAIPRDDTWRVTAIAVGADGARFARARVP